MGRAPLGSIININFRPYPSESFYFPVRNCEWHTIAGGSKMEPTIAVGAQVSVRNTLCTVRFVGPTSFAEGEWVGVEFPTACGRNDGSVEGQHYFRCAPKHGLFVKKSQVQHASEANARIERDAPERHVGAWTAMEQVLEAESIAAASRGDHILQHLESLYPQSDGVGGGGGKGAAVAVARPQARPQAWVSQLVGAGGLWAYRQAQQAGESSAARREQQRAGRAILRPVLALAAATTGRGMTKS